MKPENPSAYSLSELLEIMARLRAPDGCPWDRKQTHHSLLNHLIEESYEFVDAVENGDRANMKEELGDVLLQVVFHAQLAQETGDFDFAQVVHGISEKLVRRHPHVFG
ncbi:MAG: MazG nucleotide pyrophosphohydrolase domain-containing protein, partial [Fibrobacteria bacterium]